MTFFQLMQSFADFLHSLFAPLSELSDQLLCYDYGNDFVHIQESGHMSSSCYT